MTFVSPEIPDEIVSLGVILGVLTPANGVPPGLNTAWFADPIGETSGVLTDAGRRQELITFAEDLLGSAVDELDLPDIDPAQENWIPIVTTGAGATTGGLFAIIDMRTGTPIVSLGGRAVVVNGDLTASLTIRVPMIEVGAGGLDLLVGSDRGDIEVAVNLTVPDLGLAGVVELSGASFVAVLPTDLSDPSVAIVLKGLLLPGDPAPADVPLDELIEDLGADALRILIGLLGSQDTLTDEVADLLALIGLDPASPIPELPIVDLVDNGAVALRQWVADVVDRALDDWLQRLAGFLGVPAVVGSGPASDPYKISIDDPPVEACLTLVVTTDPQSGAVSLVPGAEVKVAAPPTSAVPGNLTAAMSFVTMVLDHGLTVTSGPSLRTFGELGDGDLIDETVDVFDIEVGLVRGGLVFEPGGTIEPMLEAVDVTVGSDTYPVLDLASVDAVTEAAAGALGDVVDHLLGLLGVDDNREAEALAILAGLRKPAAAPADWPDTVGLPAFFSDPVGAIGCYHASVLEQPARWSLLAAELGVLFSAAGAPPVAVAGTGTEADPWAVTVFDNSGDGDPVEGSARLVAWADTPAGPGFDLHLVAEAVPAMADLGPSVVNLVYSSELLRVGLPAPLACPGPVTLTWAPSHRAVLRLAPMDIDVEPIRLTASAVELGGVFSQAEGFVPIFGATALALSIDGTDFDFGNFSIGDLFDLAGFNNLPWDGIQLLLGDWFASFDGNTFDVLGRLFGWFTGDGGNFNLPQLPDLDLDFPDFPSLDLGSLLLDPLSAILDWIKGLFGSGGGGLPGFLAVFSGLGEILAGVAAEISGTGTYDEPWALPLAGSGAELLLWADPDGPSLGGISEIVDHLLPSDLLDAPNPDLDDILALLDRAGRFIPSLGDRLGPADLPAALTAMRDRLEGDGLVSAADQQPAGWNVVEMAPTAHLLEPSAFTMPPGSGAIQVIRRIFVTSAVPGTAAWPGQDTATVVDLTEAGIRPESIDLSGITAGTGWVVILPAEADAVVPDEPAISGFDRLVDRLTRAVDHIHGIVGGNLALIGHSTAGQVARVVASRPASATNITHLITVGTPHAGSTFEYLDRFDTGEALRSLQRLRALLDDTALTSSELRPLIQVLETIDSALDPYVPGEGGIAEFVPFPVSDFSVPPTYPDVGAGTTAHAVVGQVAPEELDAAIVGFIRKTIEAALGLLPTDTAVTHLGLGLRATVAPIDTTPGAVSAAAKVRLDLHRIRLAPGPSDRTVPLVTAELQVRRNGGWLAGGPDPSQPSGTPRDPRVRWMEARTVVDPADVDDSDLEIILHDAAVFGTHKEQWLIDRGSVDDTLNTLVPEARILLGEAAGNIADLATDSANTRLAEVLEALGIADLDTGAISLVTDAVERFLVDPVGEIRSRISTHEADIRIAVEDWLGIPIPTDDVAIPLGPGIALTAALQTVGFEVNGFEVGGVLTLAGGVTIDRTGVVDYDLTVGTSETPGPLGAVELRVHGDSSALPGVELRGLGLDELPTLMDVPLPLVPLSDVPRLIEFAVRLLGGELARRLLDHVHAEMAEAQAAGLEALLDLLGLVRSNGEIRNLAGLFVRPLEWLTVPATLGTAASLPGTLAGAIELDRDKLRSLFDAMTAFTGITGPPGVLPLPWDLSLSAASASPGGVAVTIGWNSPVVGDNTELSGALTLTVLPGFDVKAAVAIAIEIDGTGLDHARLNLDAGQTTDLGIAIQASGQDEVVLTLLPTPSGFEALAGAAAGAAVQSLLPLVLDALGQHADIGTSVQTLGDDLGVRIDGSFSATELATLVADPATELVSRLRSGADSILADLNALLTDVTAAGGITVSGRAITFEPEAGYRLTVEIPVSGAITVCLDIVEARLIDEMRTDVALCVGSDGLESLAISLEVDDPAFLEAGGISFLPHLAFLMGDAAGPAGDRFEAGLWVEDPASDPRHGVFVKVPFDGAVDVVCRELSGTAAPVDSGVEECLQPMLREWVIPLATELVLVADDVRDFLSQTVGSGTDTLGRILSDSQILTQDNPNEWHLAPGVFDELIERLISLAGRVVEAITAAIDLGQVQLSLESRDAGGGRKEFGVGVDLGEDLVLVNGADVRLSLTEPPGDPGGVTVFLVSTRNDFTDPDFALGIDIEKVGLRVDHPQDQKLLDLGASIDAIEALVTFSIDDAGLGSTALEFVFENLAIPVGSAQGSNPVAAALLSSDTEDNQSGDPEEVAPALSPRLIINIAPDPGFDVKLDVGEGPWWIPIQRAFGPIYIEQIGGNVANTANGDVESVTILLDGGVELSGLAIGVDDLGLTIPWNDAWDVTEWELDLMGLAVGYSGSGVTLAGGLVKNTPAGGGVEYVGLIQIDALSFGLSAVGAYGEFPDPDLAGSTYTSLFVIAAVSASLGGPPFFFVTGLGGGIGLNRALVLPEDVTAIPGFPLVAAMDSSSGFADDPMRVLRDVSTSFPARRGNFWFAAGVRFTSFVLLESVAVLAVEVGDEVEIALLGVSRAVLPDPAFPIASIELALIARFSSEEGVLWVQAQLTDNSWLLSEDCRLTGGFAFVTWFNRGEFVFTIGGYHPRFAVPAYYPSVPRLGFNWTVSGAIVIKGENYFALTSSAIMAGGRLEASYTTSNVWASFTAGLDAIVSWDPFFYDVEIYVRVSAGIKIRICFFKCATIKMGFSIGARVRVWGPDLQGRAELELGPISVTVKFGASAQPENKAIPWAQFVDKFLVQGNPSDESMSANVVLGLLAPDPGSGTDPDDGSSARPWRVNPEFAMAFETRAASNEVRAGNQVQGIEDRFDIAPVGVADVNSVFRITITNIHDTPNVVVTDDLVLLPGEVSQLPDGPWFYVARESRAPAAGYVNAMTGGVLVAALSDSDDDIMVDLKAVETSKKDHPLPFHEERKGRIEFRVDVAAANRFLDEQPQVTGQILAAASIAIDDLSVSEIRTFSAERTSPPRLAPLTEGMVDKVRKPLRTKDMVVEPAPTDVDRSTQPPIVMGVLRRPLTAKSRPHAHTTVDASPDIPRVTAPTVSAVVVPGGDFPRARLAFAPSRLTRASKTVVPRDAAAKTKPALRGKELRGGFRADPKVARKLGTMAKRMLNGGQAIEAGDVVLLRLPNTRHDRNENRPRLLVEGNQDVRLVGLDRTGAPIFDVVSSEEAVALPAGTERIAVSGLGSTTTQPDGAGLSGWHARMMLQQVHSNTYLGVRSIVRSAASRIRRTGSAVTVANVSGSAATAGPSVTTLLPGATSVVLIGLSAMDSATSVEQAFHSISLGLFGASRTLGPDARPRQPLMVVSGDQVFGIFEVEPNDDGGPWVTVSVESDARWTVTAVGGATGRPESLLDDLSGGDLDSLFPDGSHAAGRSTLRFRMPQEEPSPKRARTASGRSQR